VFRRLTFVGSNKADYAARAAYADRLLDAQRKYLSVQSLRIFDGIHNGELGAQVRDMIAAEHKVLEKRRALARQQNMATIMAVAGVAGGIATGAGGRSCRDSRTQAEYNRCVRNQRARNSIVPALEQQTTVTVDLLDSNETITAIRYEDLQTKLQDLYSARQRSLDTVATQCAYVDAGKAKRGTWLGVCENGLANGSGAGVLETPDNVMEYYGYARNGMADGPGLMIRHTPLGTVSYEGNFANGRPDGTVRVSQSGRKDQTRTYVSGVDTGESTQKAASPFAGRTGGTIN